jgi:CRISPR-associated endonuclease/helicase Cas3
MNQPDDETAGIEMVINRFARTWTLLLQYDEDSLGRPKPVHPSHKSLDYKKAKRAIASLKTELTKRGEAGDLFGLERAHQLQGILGNISQTFDGKDLYPTVEEKAACLLYFVIKDHPFSDGNKRIGSFLFLLFLEENGLLEKSGMNHNGLVTLALLIAESDPRQKDLLFGLVLNLLHENENDLYNFSFPIEGEVEETRTYYKYWGKAEKEGSNYHLLLYHCLDVAAVGKVLLTRNEFIRKRLAGAMGLEEQLCVRWLTLFLALHDIGKFSESFQNLRPDLLEALQGKTSSKAYSVRHDSLGYLLWREYLWDTLTTENTSLFPEIGQDLEDWQDLFESLMKSFAGHHGTPPTLKGPNGIPLFSKSYFTEDDIDAAQEYLKALRELFPSLTQEANFPHPSDLEESITRSSWLIAGFVVLCDWIGSNNSWFTLQSKPIALPAYWKSHALPQAQRALLASGLGRPKATTEEPSFARFYPGFTQLTPLQKHIADCPLAFDPQLFILEDVTGSGKTEAAITLGGRLMSANLGQGIFIALPTMATSNAMYERLMQMYHLLYTDKENPSLILTHAARHLSESFMASVADPKQYTADDETATTQCSAWLADNRKKALLADVGVGTIDQALLAILPTRFQSLRLFGLVGHVLIVDEVHAYDPYMNKLLQSMLIFHATLGGSAILLSATLPQHTKQELLQAFARGRGESAPFLVKEDYPLCTAYSAQSGLTETGIDATPQRRCCVDVKIVTDCGEVERLIRDASDRGQCVCWIRNTVHDALEGYTQLKDHIPTDKLMIFHARFAMGDRLKIEQSVLSTFGKKSDALERSGKVLVATQVVEQSLDLDFDLMISDLAPMDLLIQRAGRLHRHQRDERGNPLTTGEDRREAGYLVIHGPFPAPNVLGDWYKAAFPKAAFVYPSHGHLWLTAQLFVERGELRMPDDARLLIEAAFSDQADKIPEPLRKRDNNAEAQQQADKSLAHINMLKLDEGYSATINQWREDMKTPTRLGAMDSTVRLARWDGRTLRPWYTDGQFPWDMSQVSLRSSLVDAEAENGDKSLAKAVAQLKEKLPDKGKWSVLVPLSQGEGGYWQGRALNNKNAAVIIDYDPVTGVMVTTKEE